MRFPIRHHHHPLALILWAAVLIWAQTLSLSHQHSDGMSDPACTVCSLAQAETAACDGALSTVPPRTPHASIPSRDPLASSAALPCPFGPRGPPLV